MEQSAVIQAKNPAITRHKITLRHHMRVRRRIHGGRREFLSKTISAQIHAWAAVISLVGITALVYTSFRQDTGKFLASLVFGISCFCLFSASALVHFFCDGFRVSRRIENLLETLDRLCIYLLIAGTYTAILYHNTHDPIRTWSLIAIWSMAFVGVIYTVFFEKMPTILQSRVVSTGQYVVMGWIGLFCVEELITNFSVAQMSLSLTGGLLYTCGALIFAFERPNISRFFGYHELWHTLVALGCLAFVAVVFLSP